MNRFIKLAGTVVCGSGALMVLSGCWHAPRPQDQTSATVYEPSGAATYSSTGAPSGDWERGYGTYKTTKAQGQTSNMQNANCAPISSSTSQWQQGYTQPRSARTTVNEPAGAQPQANAQVQTQPSTSHVETYTYNSQGQLTEGPNSGGKWRPGFNPAGTAAPAANEGSGWMPGYGTRQPIRESSGANWETVPSGTTRYEGTQTQRRYQSQSQYQSSGAPSRQQLEQQLNNQQQQINQLQHQLNQQQHQLNQSQQQTSPSSSSATPSSSSSTSTTPSENSSSSTTPSSSSGASTSSSDDSSLP